MRRTNFQIASDKRVEQIAKILNLDESVVKNIFIMTALLTVEDMKGPREEVSSNHPDYNKVTWAVIPYNCRVGISQYEREGKNFIKSKIALPGELRDSIDLSFYEGDSKFSEVIEDIVKHDTSQLAKQYKNLILEAVK